MIEQKIIEGLINSEDFLRKTKPFLKDVYFKDHTVKTIFNLVNDYVDKYNKVPNVESLKVDLSNLTVVADVQTEDLQHWLRLRRNAELKMCDWTVGADSPLSISKKTEWKFLKWLSRV